MKQLVKLVFYAGRLTCQPHHSSNEPFSTSDSLKTDADDDNNDNDNDNETLFTYSLQKVESFHINLPKIESETNKDSAFIRVHAGENKMVKSKKKKTIFNTGNMQLYYFNMLFCYIHLTIYTLK